MEDRRAGARAVTVAAAGVAISAAGDLHSHRLVTASFAVHRASIAADLNLDPAHAVVFPPA